MTARLFIVYTLSMCGLLSACQRAPTALDIDRLTRLTHTDRFTPTQQLAPSPQAWPLGSTVCVLYPYQSREEGRSTGVTSATVERINNALQEQGYQGHEGQWALVVATPERVDISPLLVDRHSNALSPQEATARKLVLPAGLEVTPCAPLALSQVLKHQVADRTYFVFASAKTSAP
ncbi:MAG: hypothetical protein RI907_2432 [Pseudomonadota bacterium]|jgi:hypothetical protein